GCVHEIEQVAAGTATADSTTLNWIPRRDVLRNPSLGAIISGGDVEIPNTRKIRSVVARISVAAVPVIASGLGPHESDGGAVWVAGNGRYERCVQDWSAIDDIRANVHTRRPGHSFVM